MVGEDHDVDITRHALVSARVRAHYRKSLHARVLVRPGGEVVEELGCLTTPALQTSGHAPRMAVGTEASTWARHRVTWRPAIGDRQPGQGAADPDGQASSQGIPNWRSW